MSPYDAEDYQRVATLNNFSVFHSIVKYDEFFDSLRDKVLWGVHKLNDSTETVTQPIKRKS